MIHNKSIPHIAIVGAGQLGSRHLQGLAKIDRDIQITVVDPNPAALERSRQRFDKMPPNVHIRSIRYIDTHENFDNKLDISIIATNADVRRKVIETLLSKVQIKYLILEKIAFQSVPDFHKVISLLKSKKIKAWVNCPRRMYPFFKNLKAELNHEDRILIKQEGNNWNLASNAIHMLDLFAFLIEKTLFLFDASGLDGKVYKSKKNGFVELGGILEAKSARGDKLTLIDNKESKDQFVLSITSENHRYMIYQFDEKVFSAHRNDGWEEKEELIKLPLQSELTHLAINQILDTGKCDITPIMESFALHKPMLDAFNMHLSAIHGKSINVCPIT